MLVTVLLNRKLASVQGGVFCACLVSRVQPIDSYGRHMHRCPHIHYVRTHIIMEEEDLKMEEYCFPDASRIDTHEALSFKESYQILWFFLLHEKV